MEERGATEIEVRQTLIAGRTAHARYGRQAREMVFSQGYHWIGRDYPQKMVRVIFVPENVGSVVVTVYTYYGIWEGG